MSGLVPILGLILAACAEAPPIVDDAALADPRALDYAHRVGGVGN